MGVGINKREIIARRAAQELTNGMVVNLGIGIPTMVADYLPEDVHIVLHGENGILGYGPTPKQGEEDPICVMQGDYPLRSFLKPLFSIAPLLLG